MNIEKFSLSLLKRRESFFTTDLNNNNNELSEALRGSNILVIGGAGTIGSSFIKAAIKYKPASIIVVDLNENGLTELVRDLRSTSGQFIPETFITYPLSFDSNAFRKLFIASAPFDIVANFAAHKHVRSEKDIFSIEALLENNIVKANALLELLINHPPKHFFCVSTDKAANPVNIMGASKRVMEEMILSYSPFFKVSTARFANVAFSNGSLLDGFLRRIGKLQPLACPSDVKRFFVSPQEAGEICLLACILGKSGEIFFPKMDFNNGQIKFSEFVDPLLRNFGFTQFICNSEEEAKKSVAIISKGLYPVFYFKTDTSGEKLYEEFYTDSEDCVFNRFQSLGVINKEPKYNRDEFFMIINDLKRIISNANTTKVNIVEWLKLVLPDFDHIETGKNLDYRM